MWTSPQKTADLFKFTMELLHEFTKEIINAKLHFLCNDKLTGLKKTNFEKAVEYQPIRSQWTPLYPLKTSENSKVFWYFQRAEKVSIGKEWAKALVSESNKSCLRQIPLSRFHHKNVSWN